MEKWKREENYMGEDLRDYFILYAHHRDSEPLDESNYYYIKERFENLEGARVVRFSHWAVGWVEAIMIHQDAVETIEKAKDIEESLLDYPVLDEDDFSMRENEIEESD